MSFPVGREVSVKLLDPPKTLITCLLDFKPLNSELLNQVAERETKILN